VIDGPVLTTATRKTPLGFRGWGVPDAAMWDRLDPGARCRRATAASRWSATASVNPAATPASRRDMGKRRRVASGGRAPAFARPHPDRGGNHAGPATRGRRPGGGGARSVETLAGDGRSALRGAVPDGQL